MAEAGPSLSRRSLFAAVSLVPALVATAPTAEASPIQALRAERAEVRKAIDAVTAQEDDDDLYEAELARLCDVQDGLAERMVNEPIRSAADARAKLSVVDELYWHPMHSAGFDRVLFDQVLTWLDAVSGAG